MRTKPRFMTLVLLALLSLAILPSFAQEKTQIV